jgi:arylsulfatase A-like enzyme
VKILIFAIIFSGLCAGSRAADMPNILVVVVDDMGYGDAGCYNPNSKIPTPHIDRLAREGMRFTDAHAPGALCHPSRYGLMTGRYPFRTDVSVWPTQPLIAEGQMTIASLLRDQGYDTAHAVVAIRKVRRKKWCWDVWRFFDDGRRTD